MGKHIVLIYNDECLREVVACESDFIQIVSLNLLIIFLQPLTLISGEDESYFHPHICN